MKRWLQKTYIHHAWTIALVALVVLMSAPVHAQGPITVTQNEHEHEFKGPMTFRLAAESDQDITSVRLFYRVSGQTASHREELTFEPNTSVEVEHTEDMGDEENYRPPMITFTYWWMIEDKGGNHFKTDPISFVYTDTRYEWQTLESDRVRLYWHDQDDEFGQAYFEKADQAAKELAEVFGVTVKDPVSIAIYNSHEELMSVLQEASAEWTGAVNFGDTGSIAIGLGSRAWMEQVIPHELTHAMLDQTTKPPFGDIPRWLHEGLAVRSEGGASIEELAALSQAIEADDLISLRVLNSPFPDQRDRAILSYAESSSLVEFIIEEYGPDKLGELIAVFAEGAHYDDAMLEVFGVDMDGMEDLWRAHIGAQPRSGATRATVAPSETPTLEPTPSPVPAQTHTPAPTASPQPTAPQPTATALAAAPTATADQPAPPAPTAAATPAPASRAPCLGAAPVLGMVALFVLFRPRSAR